MANSGNPSYFETRAIEYIEEAKLDRLQIRDGVPNDAMGIFTNLHNNYQHNLIRAIQMLTIAVLKVEDGEV